MFDVISCIVQFKKKIEHKLYWYGASKSQSIEMKYHQKKLKSHYINMISFVTYNTIIIPKSMLYDFNFFFTFFRWSG